MNKLFKWRNMFKTIVCVLQLNSNSIYKQLGCVVRVSNRLYVYMTLKYKG